MREHIGKNKTKQKACKKAKKAAKELQEDNHVTENKTTRTQRNDQNKTNANTGTMKNANIQSKHEVHEEEASKGIVKKHDDNLK